MMLLLSSLLLIARSEKSRLLLQTTTTCYKENCQQKVSIEVSTFAAAGDWNSCGRACNVLYGGCKAWSYNTNTNQCKLYSANELVCDSIDTNNKGWISGGNQCPVQNIYDSGSCYLSGCYPQYTPSAFYTFIKLPSTDTDIINTCGKLCNQNDKCLSWYTDEYNKNCHLTSTAIKASDCAPGVNSNFVTGNKKCPDTSTANAPCSERYINGYDIPFFSNAGTHISGEPKSWEECSKYCVTDKTVEFQVLHTSKTQKNLKQVSTWWKYDDNPTNYKAYAKSAGFWESYWNYPQQMCVCFAHQSFIESYVKSIKPQLDALWEVNPTIKSGPVGCPLNTPPQNVCIAGKPLGYTDSSYVATGQYSYKGKDS
eukprot:30435_1